MIPTRALPRLRPWLAALLLLAGPLLAPAAPAQEGYAWGVALDGGTGFGARPDLRELEQLFRDPAAEQNSQLVLQLIAGGQKLFRHRQLQRVAQGRDTPRNDGDFVHRLPGGH